MNEAWFGARITGPFGTFSLPIPARAERDQRVQHRDDAHDLVDGLGLVVAHALVERVEVLLRPRVLVDLRLDLDVGHRVAPHDTRAGAHPRSVGAQPTSGSTIAGCSIT